MAKVLQEYDYKEQNQRTAGRPQIYPWDDWMDGRIWMLTRGEDYQIETSSMIHYVRRKVRAYGLKASVYLHYESEDDMDGSIVIEPHARKKDHGKAKSKA